MDEQCTIRNEVSLKGIGLHTGEKVKVVLKPATVNSGINFIRVDLSSRPVVAAHISNIVDSSRRPRRTSLAENGAEVHTIEHLMATLCAFRIDNVNVEIDRPELPGLDGSALGFMEAVKSAGIRKLGSPRRYFHLSQPYWTKHEDTALVFFPDDKFRVSYTLSYNHPLLRSQYADLILDDDTFSREIAPSRTFCLEEEIESLRSQGLGKGANCENTVVVARTGIKDNKLRFNDECVRHKILDLIGDVYLLPGFPLVHVVAVKSGHSLTLNLLQKINSREGRTRDAGISAQSFQPGPVLDAAQIQKILPHRYPFLFIDRVIELEEDKRAVGVKNVTINDNFFTGHFPGHPIMPGVLVVEAMAQLGGVLMLNKPERMGKLAYFMSMDNVKFRKAVVPGDQLRLEVEVVKLKSRIGRMHACALVDGDVVAEADLMFALVERE